MGQPINPATQTTHLTNATEGAREAAQVVVADPSPSIPADVLFLFKGTSKDADFATGDPTGTLGGAAVVAGGELDLGPEASGFDDFVGAGNFDATENFTLRFGYRPKYGGSPIDGFKALCWIGKDGATVDNLIALLDSGNQVQVDIGNPSGDSLAINDDSGVSLNNTIGVQVEIQLAFAGSGGNITDIWLSTNGVEGKHYTGLSIGQTALRDFVRFGDLPAFAGGPKGSSAKFDNIVFFNTTKAANYTPFQPVESSGLQSTHFTLTDADGDDFYVWLNLDGAGVDPAPGGTGIEVAASAIASAATLAEAITVAINGQTGFNASRSGAVVSVSNEKDGAATDTADGDTGFSFAVVAQGKNADFSANKAVDTFSNDPAAF